MISKNSFYLSGREKFEAQDFEGALNDYSKAIEQEENPSIYSERAVVYFYLKQLNLSLKDMNHAAELEPDNPYRYSSRAYIKDAMGNTAEAIKDYERAVELDPEDSIAYNNLGLLQEKLGYMEQSKKNFKKADSLEGVDELLEKLRKEHAEESKQKQQSQSKESIQITHQEREEISLFALLKSTFTSRSGFSEYIKFIKNGFRIN